MPDGLLATELPAGDNQRFTLGPWLSANNTNQASGTPNQFPMVEVPLGLSILCHFLNLSRII